MFDALHSRYRNAVRRNDLNTQEAVIRALHWFATRPWIRTLPDWVLALGITPEPAATPAPPPRPKSWSGLTDQFRDPNASANPVTRSPNAWSAADTLIGGSAYSLIVSATLSAVQQQVAINVVWPLVLAADAIESELAPGATETAAHVQWRADLASANALVADIDGGASTGATLRQLQERLQTARSMGANLSPGKAALLDALALPVEPPKDRAFANAAEALRLFFT